MPVGSEMIYTDIGDIYQEVGHPKGKYKSMRKTGITSSYANIMEDRQDLERKEKAIKE